MAESKFAHNVYFSLKDNSPAACQSLVAGCHEYLAEHEGIESFAAGVLADTQRDVNDRDFSVSLHILFKDRAAHDAYQVAPRHDEFIAAMKDNWQSVRVFDTDC